MLAGLLRRNRLRERIAESRDRLYRTAVAWTADPMRADDLVQEALSRALRHCAGLRDPERLDAWLYRVLYNCWQDCLRDIERNHLALDDERLAHDQGPVEMSCRGETVERVRAAIERLSAGQRAVVILVDLEGFSYADVAGILQVPIGTVMSRLSRARRQLLGLLGDAPAQTGPDERMRNAR